MHGKGEGGMSLSGRMEGERGVCILESLFGVYACSKNVELNLPVIKFMGDLADFAAKNGAKSMKSPEYL